MKNSLFIILLNLLLFSCSQDNLLDDGKNKNAIDDVLVNESQLIDKTSVNLVPEDAKKVALFFRSGHNAGASSTKSVVSDNLNIQTISDKTSNVPLLYVINWNDNKGYVVISGNKKNSPIVAFSESGSFNPEADLASKDYIERYKSQMRDTYNDVSDSLRLKYSLEWSLFEKAELKTVTKSTNPEIQKMIQDEINRKKALGYTYLGDISLLAYHLSPEVYPAVKRDIAARTDPRYNSEEVSLFFIRSNYRKQIGPLINTKWHQGMPFSVDAPNGYAGCVPVAVAQIAYYHKYPSKYNWSQIYPNPILNSAFKYFILDIRSLCKVKYEGSKGTGSTYEKAYDAFKSLGYVAQKGGMPDFIKLRNEINSERPVYIRGENAKTGAGHAWVCEGYLNREYQGVVSFVGNPFYMEPEANFPYNDYPVYLKPPSVESYGEFYYMNMGWEGENDGWYRSNTYFASNPDSCYLTDQKIIIVKR